MRYFDWDEEKNEILSKNRGITFGEIRVAVEEHKVLDTYDHPNQKRYPGQKIAARNTSNKTRNINIRLSEKDLHKIKVKAAKEGIPYQTLASSVFHKFANKEANSSLQF